MANALDLISLDEARDAIGATLNQSYDAELETLVTAVSTRFDSLCGPIVNRSVTEWRDGGTCDIRLRQAPVSSFTSVTEYYYGNGTVLTAEQGSTGGTYLYDDATETIYRRLSFQDYWFKPGRRNIKLIYVAGRAADTASVPERFKQAAKITIAHIWRNEKGSGNQTFGADGELNFRTSFSIPNRAMELIADDVIVPGIA